MRDYRVKPKSCMYMSVGFVQGRDSGALQNLTKQGVISFPRLAGRICGEACQVRPLGSSARRPDDLRGLFVRSLSHPVDLFVRFSSSIRLAKDGRRRRIWTADQAYTPTKPTRLSDVPIEAKGERAFAPQFGGSNADLYYRESDRNVAKCTTAMGEFMSALQRSTAS